MAAPPGEDPKVEEQPEEEEEDVQAKGVDYDALRDIARRMNFAGDPQPILARVLIGGRRGNFKEESIRSAFEADVMTEREPSVAFTGILCELQGNLMLYFEAEVKRLRGFLQKMRKLCKGPEAPFESLQVFFFEEDVKRKFPKWVVISSPNQGVPVPKRESHAKLIRRRLDKIYNLGEQLQTKEKLQVETFLAQVKSTRPELLPTVTELDAILDSNMCFDLEEWSGIFLDSVQISQDSENVWPYPPPLPH